MCTTQFLNALKNLKRSKGILFKKLIYLYTYDWLETLKRTTVNGE